MGEELGEIIEHRSHFGIVQTSHCFMADATEEGAQELTEKELNDGFELVWVPYTEAVSLVSDSKPADYAGKFIVIRDLQYLKEAKEYF